MEQLPTTAWMQEVERLRRQSREQPCFLQFILPKSFYLSAEVEHLEVVWVYIQTLAAYLNMMADISSLPYAHFEISYPITLN